MNLYYTTSSIRQYIILRTPKDDKGNSVNIDYPINETIKIWYKQIVEYLEFLSEQEIVYPHPKCTTAVKRIFNNCSWQEGGRYYLPLQGMPMCETERKPNHIPGTYYRKDILINNQQITEVDFGSLHPTMIYHLNNVQPQGKPYVVIDAPKEWVKLWILIAINASCLNTAKYSFTSKYIVQKFLIDHPEYQNTELTREKIKTNFYKEYSLLETDANELINNIHTQFLLKHPVLSHYLGTGFGIKLQFHDSEIMRLILEQCLKHNIVALPVHDSVIVTPQHIKQIQYIMKKCYAVHMKTFFNMTIDPIINVEVKIKKNE